MWKSLAILHHILGNNCKSTSLTKEKQTKREEDAGSRKQGIQHRRKEKGIQMMMVKLDPVIGKTKSDSILDLFLLL